MRLHGILLCQTKMTSLQCPPVGIVSQNLQQQQIVIHRNKMNSTNLKVMFYNNKKQLHFYFMH
eukprot:5622292-Ditylum_brightwellii.AAC.1